MGINKIYSKHKWQRYIWKLCNKKSSPLTQHLPMSNVEHADRTIAYSSQVQPLLLGMCVFRSVVLLHIFYFSNDVPCFKMVTFSMSYFLQCWFSILLIFQICPITNGSNVINHFYFLCSIGMDTLVKKKYLPLQNINIRIHIIFLWYCSCLGKDFLVLIKQVLLQISHRPVCLKTKQNSITKQYCRGTANKASVCSI